MADLKRILILSYFFPPCNLTAAQRTRGWAEYLHQFGYYPIIITRNWENTIHGPDDMHHDSGKEIIHEVYDTHAVYYLPFRGNLRDRLYSKYGKNQFNTVRKALSLMELVGHHFHTGFIPFANMHSFADQYLSNNPDIGQVIVSGNPFEIFRFGYLLQKKHGISWIADYRDDWNTSEVNDSRGFIGRFLKKLEERSERKYMHTASCITSISPYYAQKIGAFNSRPAEVVLNGFFPEDYRNYQHLPLFDAFTVVYNGMLYPSQEIEVFLDGFKSFVNKHANDRARIRLRFPGILFLKEVAARVASLMKGYEDVLEMTPRVPREQVLEIQAKAHVLLMVSHREAKGIPSSKIYEYIGLGKPVLVCPTDGDILEETFSGYNLGKIAGNAAEAEAHLESWFQRYAEGTYEGLRADETYVNQFTRDHQAGVVAGILKRYT